LFVANTKNVSAMPVACLTCRLFFLGYTLFLLLLDTEGTIFHYLQEASMIPRTLLDLSDWAFFVCW
jgi:hypothetical protein